MTSQKTGKPEYDVPVLIVGGGPTGLTSALLLSRYGLRPLLVERRAGTSDHPRARGLNVRTMEILHALGLEPQVRLAGQALKNSRYMLFVESLAGREIRRVQDEDFGIGDARLAALSPTGYCQCAQDDLEPILLESARAHGAQVRFGIELIDALRYE